MEITTEIILLIYSRAIEYGKAAFTNIEADKVELTDDGSIQLRWSGYGRCDDDTEIIYPDKLTANLDEIYAIRKQKEAERERQIQIERQKQEAARLIREKNQRRSDYLKLKQEFENENL